MSGEQASAKSSHMRNGGEPFLLADDLEFRRAMIEGLSALTQQQAGLAASVGGLSQDVEGMASVVSQLCGEVQGLSERIDRTDKVVLEDHAPRITGVEQTQRKMPQPVRLAGKAGLWITFGMGLLSYAAQIAAQLQDGTKSPLQAAIEVFERMSGAQ